MQPLRDEHRQLLTYTEQIPGVADDVGDLAPEEFGGRLDRLTRDGFDADAGRQLRRVLYGLHPLVSVHFAKEEEIYVPLLEERLSAEQAHDLLAAMHQTGGHAHHH